MAKFKKKLPKPFLVLPIFIIKKVINVKPIGGFAANEKLFFNKDKMSCEVQMLTYYKIQNSEKRLLTDVLLFNMFESIRQLEYSIFREVDESFLTKVFFFDLRFHWHDFSIQQCLLNHFDCSPFVAF